MTGVNFSALRTVTTFSWLSVDQHGHGFGHEMRAALLHLAFAGLGASEPALLNRWRLARDNWEPRRRDDIQLHNIEACHALLPLS